MSKKGYKKNKNTLTSSLRNDEKSYYANEIKHRKKKRGNF